MQLSESHDGCRPAVSVLMPVFNAARYLSSAVESILDQTFSDFELVILDDGSTDASLEIARGYEERDDRVRVISGEHDGIVHARNKLLGCARGEFVACFDGDDLATPRRLEQQVAYLRGHSNVVCVGGAFQNMDHAGRYLTTLYPPRNNDDIQAQLLRGHCAVPHPAAMARLSAVRSANGYRREYELAEDLDLWLRLGEIGELANLEEVVLKYRLHENATSEKFGREQRDITRKVCKSAWERRGVSGVVFEAYDLWRPGADRDSRHKFFLRYGWWAWNSGQRRTAQIYGWKAILEKLFSVKSWALLIVAVMKPLEHDAETN